MDLASDARLLLTKLMESGRLPVRFGRLDRKAVCQRLGISEDGRVVPRWQATARPSRWPAPSPRSQFRSTRFILQSRGNEEVRP